MKLLINAQEKNIEHSNLAQLVQDLGYERPVVIAVNHVHILRSQWESYTLYENDSVDVLMAIVGG
ncbi:MAG: ThiS family [Burkholderiaceae bacterium]|nr:ThiS family [Burkholderiaceae bacterium]